MIARTIIAMIALVFPVILAKHQGANTVRYLDFNATCVKIESALTATNSSFARSVTSSFAPLMNAGKL